jgi:hypothetical protein
MSNSLLTLAHTTFPTQNEQLKMSKMSNSLLTMILII